VYYGVITKREKETVEAVTIISMLGGNFVDNMSEQELMLIQSGLFFFRTLKLKSKKKLTY